MNDPRYIFTDTTINKLDAILVLLADVMQRPDVSLALRDGHQGAADLVALTDELDGLVAYMKDANVDDVIPSPPRKVMAEPDENPSDRYDRMADQFYRETGIMAPGKDVARLDPTGGGGTYDERCEAWGKWITERAKGRQ